VEWLKVKALSSNPSTAKKKKRKKERTVRTGGMTEQKNCERFKILNMNSAQFPS
jgi:cytochrome c-type biogenesis protein CcmE